MKKRVNEEHELIMRIDVIGHRLRMEAGKLLPSQVNNLGKDILELISKIRDSEEQCKELIEVFGCEKPTKDEVSVKGYMGISSVVGSQNQKEKEKEAGR